MPVEYFPVSSGPVLCPLLPQYLGLCALEVVEALGRVSYCYRTLCDLLGLFSGEGTKRIKAEQGLLFTEASLALLYLSQNCYGEVGQLVAKNYN